MESTASGERVRTGKHVSIFHRIRNPLQTAKTQASQEQSCKTSLGGFSFSSVPPESGDGSPTLKDILAGFTSDEAAAAPALAEVIAKPEPVISLKEPDTNRNGECLPESEVRVESVPGTIKEKIKKAEAVDMDASTQLNRDADAPKADRPERPEPKQIDIRLGASWIDVDYYNQFMWETFDTPFWLQNTQKQGIHIEQNSVTHEWTVQNAESDNGIKSRMTFGTQRASAYSLLQDTLNIIDATVFDENNKINHKETMLAQAKQNLIKNVFCSWVFADNNRGQYLAEKINGIVSKSRYQSHVGEQASDIQALRPRNPAPAPLSNIVDDFILSC